jgi:ABC-type glycerol-3-phosphate transport system substrate-binding protein
VPCSRTSTSASTLDFWWWGEDEAPGLGEWLRETCSAFEEATGTRIALRLLRHDEVLPGFPAAVKAGRGPDLHFFWNGIYLVDHVWRGYVRALDDLIEPAELAAIGGGPQSTVDGKTYRVAWYVIPVVWVTNRAVLDRAGVDAIPTTYDEFVDACERVKRAGLTPLAAGDGEGDISVWWLTHFLTQELDDPADAVRLVLGELDWPARPWELLAEVRKAFYFDPAVLPLTLWAGLEHFNAGTSAFTLASGPMFNGCRRALGDAVTVSVAPIVGNGALAGLPIVDTQGVGVASPSTQPAAAAEFLCFLHADERKERLWEDVRLFPADRRWTGPSAADADYAQMWAWYTHGPRAPYVPNLMPLELHYELAAIGQGVLAGKLDAAAAANAAAASAGTWRESDVERTARYAAWAFSAAQ